jgi:hypothetical protein
MMRANRYQAVIAMFVSTLAAWGVPAAAQTTQTPGSAPFDNAAYGIVEFGNLEDLYSQLTEPGRCPVNEMAPERQPCAFIFYERVSGVGKMVNFKPIFKVESDTQIWAMHDGKLKKVSAKILHGDNISIRGQSGQYRAFGIVGNTENQSNCEAGRRCLADLVEEDMFLMYGMIPDMVVQKLWHNRRVDPGMTVTRRQ